MATFERPFSGSLPKENTVDVEDSPAIYIQRILSERNESRNQNIQLWSIVQKQRIIIQQQQEFISKLCSDTPSPSVISDTEMNKKISRLEKEEFTDLETSKSFVKSVKKSKCEIDPDYSSFSDSQEEAKRLSKPRLANNTRRHSSKPGATRTATPIKSVDTLKEKTSKKLTDPKRHESTKVRVPKAKLDSKNELSGKLKAPRAKIESSSNETTNSRVSRSNLDPTGSNTTKSKVLKSKTNTPSIVSAQTRVPKIKSDVSSLDLSKKDPKVNTHPKLVGGKHSTKASSHDGVFILKSTFIPIQPIDSKLVEYSVKKQEVTNRVPKLRKQVSSPAISVPNPVIDDRKANPSSKENINFSITSVQDQDPRPLVDTRKTTPSTKDDVEIQPSAETHIVKPLTEKADKTQSSKKKQTVRPSTQDGKPRSSEKKKKVQVSNEMNNIVKSSTEISNSGHCSIKQEPLVQPLSKERKTRHYVDESCFTQPLVEDPAVFSNVEIYSTSQLPTEDAKPAPPEKTLFDHKVSTSSKPIGKFNDVSLVRDILEDENFQKAISIPRKPNLESRNSTLIDMSHQLNPIETQNTVDILQNQCSQPESVVYQTKLTSLDSLLVHVSGITTKINSRGKDVLAFRIQFNRLVHTEGKAASKNSTDSPHSKLEYLWTIEKFYSDLSDLDYKLRTCGQISKAISSKFSDKKAWNTSNPSKLEQRKIMLQTYLQCAIDFNPTTPSIMHDFITSDIISETLINSPPGQKDGYLFKCGKKFGKWKKRYFLINYNVLECYDFKNGSKLSEIQLNDVQVAIQHTSGSDYEFDETSADTLRHAFIIFESKSTSSATNRHVLCAESDAERDDWVKSIENHLPEEPADHFSKTEARVFGSNSAKNASSPNISSRYSEASPLATSLTLENTTSPTSNTNNSSAAFDSAACRSPINNMLNNNDGDSKSNLSSSKSTRTRPFKLEIKKSMSSQADAFKSESKDSEYSKPIRKTILWGKKMFKGDGGKPKSFQLPAFGVALQQSVMASKINEDYPLSSVVYRCIQYLDANGAEDEEGIYRLSGSTATIRMLKNKFDTEGDYNILGSGVNYDVHAISGLLKLYIRELPSSVLTPEKHDELVKIAESNDHQGRIKELGKLVCSLPVENYTLLRALVSHLVLIVKNYEINKMTLKNIGIVFAPTLGIPAGIFGLLMTEFKYVFITADGVDDTAEVLSEDFSDDDPPVETPSSFDWYSKFMSHQLEETSNMSMGLSNEESSMVQDNIVTSLKSKQHSSSVSKNLVGSADHADTTATLIEVLNEKKLPVRNSELYSLQAPPEIIHIEKQIESSSQDLISY